MTISEGRPDPDLAGYNLVLLNDVGQLMIEAVPPDRDGDPVLIRLTALRSGEATTQVSASLPDTPAARAFADRVSAVGATPIIDRPSLAVARTASHLRADRLRAEIVAPIGATGSDLSLRIRALERGAANDVVVALVDTPANRALASRVIKAIEG